MNAQVAMMKPSREHLPVATPDFCKAMRNLAGHCVVIASGDDQQRAGLTATAVCSITAEPPRLLVCVNRNVYAHGVITASRHLSVNVLGCRQESIARRFAGMVDGVAGEQRFDDGAWVPGISQVPVLSDALVSFECRVVEAVPASTHDMFLCEVIQVTGQMSEEDPLIYFNGRFAALA
ncbi:flavin reductase family protein [Halopseudomonas xiamenensis]|uniref:flavin reductase family protein n=1 Tax=Halopseudomonas xiamenensis TaxID=157792 RepID=UPI0016275F83|nr:flavin reductase family protein [Halopseudomonas xiamenensis]